MVPPAPPRLSMTNCCPNASLSLANRMRLTVSAPPPAGYGTITLTGRVGHSACAEAVPAAMAIGSAPADTFNSCLLYTSDAADERSSVDLGGRRIIKKK